jgi:TolB protein
MGASEQPPPEPAALTVPTPRATSPRFAGNSIVYRAPRAGIDSLWRHSDGQTVEISSSVDGRVAAGAAVSPDGQRVAVPVQSRAAMTLYVLDSDGRNARAIAPELEIRGAPAWSPDGRWLAVAAMLGEEPRLFKLPLVDGPPVQLGDDYALDPAWAPSGTFLVYTGADVGTELRIGAVNADGTPHRIPDLRLSRGSRRLDFLGNDDTLVLLKGTLSQKDIWAVDLASGAERLLTAVEPGPIVTDFDVAPDGSEIVYDRVGEASDLVLIERP